MQIAGPNQVQIHVKPDMKVEEGVKPSPKLSSAHIEKPTVATAKGPIVKSDIAAIINAVAEGEKVGSNLRTDTKPILT